MLSERQQRILNLVVGSYLESGKPVGSAAIAEDPDFDWGSSTVRAELAALEREGYLSHPHTSAGRVPTDSGYRFYADALVVSGLAPAPRAASWTCRRCAVRSRRRCARPPRPFRG